MTLKDNYLRLSKKEDGLTAFYKEESWGYTNQAETKGKKPEK